ncbi:MAG: hypothetical protein IJ588_08455 [Prevotella sp.]|nr:hypothetical protein [Prevotella sp.]
MKKIFMTLCVLLGASTMLTGCLNSDSDSEVKTYGDMAITSITLGTMNRYTQTTSSSTGNDTIVKSTFTGSGYPLSIDQLGCRIYNETELPAGTDLKHVIVTISTLNSGVVGIKSLTSDSVFYYSSTDSIDFSQPRVFRVFATNGTGSRDYTMTLTASETAGINFEWRKVMDDPSLSGWDDDTRLVMFRDSVFASTRDVIVKDDVAYSLDGGQLVRSENLEDWQPVAGAPLLSSLFAQGTKELFAIGTDGKVLHSEDDGLTWAEETLDTDAALFPTEGLVSVTWNYRNSDSTDYVLLAGSHPQVPAYMAIWRKISQYGGNGKGGQWVYMPLDETNPYLLPAQGVLSMAYYNNKVLALNDGLVMLESRDQGITWKTCSAYPVPSAMTGSRVRMTASDDSGIWLLTNSGQVWHGTKR